ncbi:Glutamyl-tRNA amidotransferase B subunit [Sistotremastrum suecicum HHB10207 ss-3]|uniref:Glutamyl-tRNA(Gln) amidotransferase subunit B, mitochondrial n=1 Tax=Sistotremastrum suecicum HHB10207 ss-3 TaxID=1314776 RepID=A0A166HPC5_9AGAM|nr:Glutamyl-tRNA amidotransferase B subunit [Sistotremastrum suecicum HHB10207 ss-3]
MFHVRHATLLLNNRLTRAYATSPELRWPGWAVVIGIETHVQIKSRQKLFSNGTHPSAQLNDSTSVLAPFDVALPGALPVLNRVCVQLGIRAAIALRANCQRWSSFDRKHYFYPDLPAGFQITQHYHPFAKGGSLAIWPDKVIRIEQIQLEQDTAKTTHLPRETLVDYGRAGVGLLEIVSRPDMRSPEEATAYVKTLQHVLRSVGVSDGNMEDGSLRCDVNVSVNRPGEQFGTRCEIKNLNSLKNMTLALNCEIKRHLDLLERGESVVQETRGFNEDTVETFTLRRKEDAPDYRYMPDPNIPPLIITESDVRAVREAMPQVPEEIRERLVQQGLPDRDINVLLSIDSGATVGFDGHVSDGAVTYFTEVSKGRSPRVVLNWIVHELLGQLVFHKLSFAENPLSAAQLGELIDLVTAETITTRAGKDVLRQIIRSRTELRVKDIVREMGLLLDTSSLEEYCAAAIAALPSEADAVRGGNPKPLNKLIGYVMRQSKGAMRPDKTSECLQKLLASG